MKNKKRLGRRFEWVQVGAMIRFGDHVWDDGTREWAETAAVGATAMSATLSAEEVRVRIADLCGTLKCPGCGWGRTECWSHDHRSPDYPNDLNAMHDAEKVLTDAQLEEYQLALCRVVAGMEPTAYVHWSDVGGFRGVFTATAEQRARAFLAVMEARG